MDKVVHFEIPFDDENRAKKFYTELFGWKIIKAYDMPYFMVTTAECDDKNIPKETGTINGGMYERDESAPNPVIVINVNDIKAYLKKVEEAGGKIKMPIMKVGDMGLYSRISDTENNVIALWQDIKH